MNNPTKDEKSEFRVFRGGSWAGSARNTRVSFRHYNYPDGKGIILGFRVVRSKA